MNSEYKKSLNNRTPLRWDLIVGYRGSQAPKCTDYESGMYSEDGQYGVIGALGGYGCYKNNNGGFSWGCPENSNLLKSQERFRSDEIFRKCCPQGKVLGPWDSPNSDYPCVDP